MAPASVFDKAHRQLSCHDQLEPIGRGVSQAETLNHCVLYRRYGAKTQAYCDEMTENAISTCGHETYIAFRARIVHISRGFCGHMLYLA